LTFKDSILERSSVYNLWQAPFARKKMAPLLTHNDLRAVRKVLDVGCGPGTNARYFEPSAYLGIDINPEYVASARKRYPGRFEVADATAFAAGGETFDFVLVNSVLHHIDDPGTVRTLERLSGLLAWCDPRVRPWRGLWRAGTAERMRGHATAGRSSSERGSIGCFRNRIASASRV
jgi:SAM-dependent methyltransferase